MRTGPSLSNNLFPLVASNSPPAELPEKTAVEGTRTVVDPASAAAAQAREMRRKGYTVAVIATRIQEERGLNAEEAEAVVRRVFREPLKLSTEMAKARMVVGALGVVAAAVAALVAYGLTEKMGWFQGLMAFGVLLGAVHFLRGFARMKEKA